MAHKVILDTQEKGDFDEKKKDNCPVSYCGTFFSSSWLILGEAGAMVIL